MSLPSIDTRKLLKTFGSVSDLQLALEIHELPVPKAGTVRQWHSRKSLPIDWLATLLLLADRQGGRLDLYEYVRNV